MKLHYRQSFSICLASIAVAVTFVSSVSMALQMLDDPDYDGGGYLPPPPITQPVGTTEAVTAIVHAPEITVTNQQTLYSYYQGDAAANASLANVNQQDLNYGRRSWFSDFITQGEMWVLPPENPFPSVENSALNLVQLLDDPGFCTTCTFPEQPDYLANLLLSGSPNLNLAPEVRLWSEVVASHTIIGLLVSTGQRDQALSFTIKTLFAMNVLERTRSPALDSKNIDQARAVADTLRDFYYSNLTSQFSRLYFPGTDKNIYYDAFRGGIVINGSATEPSRFIPAK